MRDGAATAKKTKRRSAPAQVTRPTAAETRTARWAIPVAIALVTIVAFLPVLRNGDLAGILSERDIMNRVVAVGRTPGTTAVSEVMTANPRAVAADESIEECLFIMHEFGFRHLPIVEGKELRGLVSLRDVLMHQAGEMQRQARRAAS